MKRLVFLIFLAFLGFNNKSLGQTTQFPNMAGFGVAYIPPLEEGIYFDDPFDFWPNREPSWMLQASYARHVNPSLRTGLYFEYEEIRFTDQSGTDVKSFNRFNLGIDWTGEFPAKPLHMELGGYIGFGVLEANNWANLTGFDFGMIAGPAYEKGRCGVSLHVRSGYAPYSSNGSPSGVLLFNPKILLKGYYRF